MDIDKKLCEICKCRIAEHHFVRMVDGISHTYHICSHCKAVLDNKYKEKQAERRFKSTPVQDRICTCGRTLEDFLSTGVLGCKDCYYTFYDYLVEYIRNYHGSVQHVGEEATAPPPIDIERLYQELKQAVDDGDFETAAAIKKKIDIAWGKNNG